MALEHMAGNRGTQGVAKEKQARGSTRTGGVPFHAQKAKTKTGQAGDFREGIHHASSGDQTPGV
jgi:hypothetical protein